MTVGILTFDEALKDSDRQARKWKETQPKDQQAYQTNLLTGNGFSIDWNHEIFHYNSLFDRAQLPGLTINKTDLRHAFGSDDLEALSDILSKTSTAMSLYQFPAEHVERVKQDSQIVQDGLIEALSQIHPEGAHELDEKSRDRVVDFLAEFNNIFTTNYDFLLYWSVLAFNNANRRDRFNDGFSKKITEGLQWREPSTDYPQGVYFLHGAFHLYESDSRTYKIQNGSSSLGNRLIDKAKALIKAGNAPLIVTGGTSEEKLSQIRRNEYLTFCYDEFSSAVGSLFVHGSSLSLNDDHLLSALAGERSGVTNLYVGIHAPADNQQQIEKLSSRLDKVADQRRRNSNSNNALELELRVNFYDSSTARVWRD